jgi:hypothetical protein
MAEHTPRNGLNERLLIGLVLIGLSLVAMEVGNNVIMVVREDASRALQSAPIEVRPKGNAPSAITPTPADDFFLPGE